MDCFSKNVCMYVGYANIEIYSNQFYNFYLAQQRRNTDLNQIVERSLLSGLSSLAILSSGQLGLRITGDLGTSLSTSVTGMNLCQLGSIEFGSLEDLDLPNVNILQRIDTLAGSDDVLANEFWNKLLDRLDQLYR